MAKYRILSLDGGGSWALIQVMALESIYSEATTGHTILKDFDLVAANSGGSIVLGGLIENLSLKVLKSYFLNAANRQKIFSSIGLGEALEDVVYRTIGIAPKYSTADKLSGLRELLPAFGATKMADIPGHIAQSVGRSPHFIIFGFDYDSRRASFYRSNLMSAAASAGTPVNPTLAEAINASSTAPVRYFDAPAEITPHRYWDGAIGGYNNPVLGAVVEALANEKKAQDIQALAIGTGTVRLPVRPPGVVDDSGLMQFPQVSSPKNDLQELAGSIIDDPPDAATFIAHVALGQPLPDRNLPATVSGNIVRMSPMIQPIQRHDKSWGLPPGYATAQEFLEIANLEMDAVQQADVLKIQNLAVQWMADKVVNQAIRSDAATFHCEIGHDKFSQARTAWLDLRKQP